LINTFLLLGSTSLTAWWASGGAPVRVRGQAPVAWAVGLPLAALLVVGATGAVTALGDTLFPSASLASGLSQDFEQAAPAFVRLRVLHPVLAATTAAATLVVLGLARAIRPSDGVRVLTRIAGVALVAQVGLGLADVLALAPVWLQLAHLIIADVLWIALVLTSAAALAERLPGRPAPSFVFAGDVGEVREGAEGHRM
jgi:heme A synthase